MKYAAILILIAMACWKSYDFGVDVQRGREAQYKKDAEKSQSDKADAKAEEKIKIEVKYRDRIKIIYQAADPTGCLDRTLADVGLLPDPSDSEARP